MQHIYYLHSNHFFQIFYLYDQSILLEFAGFSSRPLSDPRVLVGFAPRPEQQGPNQRWLLGVS